MNARNEIVSGSRPLHAARDRTSFFMAFPLGSGSSWFRARNQRSAELSQFCDQKFEQISDAKQKSAYTFQWIGGRTCAFWMILLKVTKLTMAVETYNNVVDRVCPPRNVVTL
jgi:hypothetical protein